jgi:hypothetical protein
LDRYVIITLSLLLLKYYLGTKSDLEMLEERDEVMRNKYYDPIEQFPDKIDQLLDALNRVRHRVYFKCS